MIEPTWEAGDVQLYLGDCLEILPQLEAGSVDAVVTDPPYGIAYNPTGGNGVAYRGNLPTVINDDKPFDPRPLLDFPKVILWGANHYSDKLPARDSWVIWYKREGIPSIDFADCEMAWVSIGGPARVINHRWHGMIRDSEAGELRVHPTQKPVAIMKWCIDRYTSPGNTILDPFMGSGTTGVACVQTGRKFIGIEIDPKYFEIAVKRISEAQLQLRLEI